MGREADVRRGRQMYEEQTGIWRGGQTDDGADRRTEMRTDGCTERKQTYEEVR